jgi:predicted RecB family endonuclease
MQAYKEVKMTGEKPCCAAAAARMIKKLALPGGEVGIVNLDNILKEVADLKLVDNEAIKKELLQRVKIYNYLAPSAEADYSKALLKEYKQQYGNPNRGMK